MFHFDEAFLDDELKETRSQTAITGAFLLGILVLLTRQGQMTIKPPADSMKFELAFTLPIHLNLSAQSIARRESMLYMHMDEFSPIPLKSRAKYIKPLDQFTMGM